MAALSAPYEAQRKDGDFTRYPLAAATQVFRGGLAVLAGGYALPAADAAGVQFVGVFAESADNRAGVTQPGAITPSIGSQPTPLLSGLTQGAAGAVPVRVERDGAFLYAKAGAVQADVGLRAFVVDDNTVSTSATAHNVPCGYVSEYVDGTHLRVRIDLAVN